MKIKTTNRNRILQYTARRIEQSNRNVFEKISSSSWRFQVGPLNVLLIPSFTEGHFSKTDKREDEQTQPESVLGSFW